MTPWRRRRKGFFDDFFGDFDDDFAWMEENFSRIFDELRKAPMKKLGEGSPFVYGFSMRVGPDGKPHIEEFGNVPGAKTGIHEITSEREPLIDVIEGEDEVTVIAELPGVEKKDVKLEAEEESLSIKVDTPNRKYSKELALPCKVKTDSIKATFNNGVLEVKIKRAEKKAKKGVDVKIE